MKVKMLVSQSCLTLCNPRDCSPPGSSVRGIFQARILEGVAVSFSRGSSWSRDQTQVTHIAGRHFNLWTTREAHIFFEIHLNTGIFSSKCVRFSHLEHDFFFPSYLISWFYSVKNWVYITLFFPTFLSYFIDPIYKEVYQSFPTTYFYPDNSHTIKFTLWKYTIQWVSV